MAAASAKAGSPVAINGETMGTTWSVKIVPTSDGAPAQAELRPAIQARLDDLDARMSTYRDDSEVVRFSRAATTNWFAVSSDTAFVVSEALRVSRLSDGAFDITVAPLVDLWGFGKNRRSQIPSKDELARARSRVGWEKLAARLSPPALRKSAPDVAIDLSGIAKGYAADAVSSLLSQRALTNHLVQIGGEVFASGVGADGQPWRVGIENPLKPGEIARTVALKNRALSTSGNYRNFHEIGGRRYGHILDPRTGWPVENDLASASTMAASGAAADAMAKVAFILGRDRGAVIARSNGVECLFIAR
ncbi:MAG: FAD:protein FMN transferase [Verrucomicrobia bacterium]|nr:FAD:protein FMN transferase [Verrucomicrobiota bacterium]